MKKYELLEHDKIIDDRGVVLYRIMAIYDFDTIKAGDLGGYIESEDNLSQEGTCWVCSKNSKVYGSSRITDAARIVGDSSIKDSCITGSAKIEDSIIIRSNIGFAKHASDRRFFCHLKFKSCYITDSFINIRRGKIKDSNVGGSTILCQDYADIISSTIVDSKLQTTVIQSDSDLGSGIKIISSELHDNTFILLPFIFIINSSKVSDLSIKNNKYQYYCKNSSPSDVSSRVSIWVDRETHKVLYSIEHYVESDNNFDNFPLDESTVEDYFDSVGETSGEISSLFNLKPILRS